MRPVKSCPFPPLFLWIYRVDIKELIHTTTPSLRGWPSSLKQAFTVLSPNFSHFHIWLCQSFRASKNMLVPQSSQSKIHLHMVTMWYVGLLQANVHIIPHKTIPLIVMVWNASRVQELRIDCLPSCFNMVNALGPPRCCTLSGRCSGNS